MFKAPTSTVEFILLLLLWVVPLGLVVRVAGCIVFAKSRASVRTHPFIHITWLVASVLLVSWGSLKEYTAKPSREFRSLLRTSTSLEYEGYYLYLDGGSMGFVFTNQIGRVLLVFVQNPFARDGVVEKNGKKIRRVFIAFEKEFASEEAMELGVGSRHEPALISLVRTALRDDLPKERREEIAVLIDMLKTRHFDWEAFEKRGHRLTVSSYSD